MLLVVIFIFGFPSFTVGQRCATGNRTSVSDGFHLLSPMLKISRTVYKSSSYSMDQSLHVLYSKKGYFRIIWGDLYDRTDPEWADPDKDGVPIWPQALAQYFDAAYDRMMAYGFPMPYGARDYYLDVYIDNTGVSIPDADPELGPFEYGVTKIYPNVPVAYFIFRRDYSNLTAKKELAILEAVTAHELFHAVQRVYYPWDDPYLVPNQRWFEERWWFEATATWMEELCAPQADDYLPYVQLFLSKPEVSLFTTDGYREYGASIFAGFLWLRFSKENIWKTIFSRAYDYGLENALQMAIQTYSSLSLADAVAAFWGLAAHPESLWNDGAEYYWALTPKIIQTVSRLPTVMSPTAIERPERYGANLYGILNASGYMGISLFDVDKNSAWRLAVSPVGSTRYEIITLHNYKGSFTKSASADVFLSVVNVSDRKGARGYRIQIDDDKPYIPMDDEESGCFINTLR